MKFKRSYSRSRKFRPRYKSRGKSRYPTKRKFYRAKRTIRRTQKDNMVHIKLSYDHRWTHNAGGIPNNQVGGAFAVSADQFGDFNSYYKQIWQYYRINMVVVKFIPCSTNKDEDNFHYSNGPTTYGQDSEAGWLDTAIDYSDVSTPTSESELLSYQNMKQTKAFRGITRKFRPALSVPSYETTTGWGYTPKWKQWLRTADPSVPHYGIKWYVMSPEAGNSALDHPVIVPRWRYETTVYMSLKKMIPGYTIPLIVPNAPLKDPAHECKENDEEEDIETVNMEDLKIKENYGREEKRAPEVTKKPMSSVQLARPVLSRSSSKIIK